jgi:hypothetical protein
MYASPPWRSLTTTAGKSDDLEQEDGFSTQVGVGDDLCGCDGPGQQRRPSTAPK